MSPAAPFAGRTVLLLGHFDDSYSGHATLKRRALERLGCQVVVVEPRPSGFFARFKRNDVTERLGAALRDHRPDLVLTLGAELPPPAVIGDLELEVAGAGNTVVKLISSGTPKVSVGVVS